ncbi:hypothetical protein B4099_3211 [Heyndrickxia coagulans]|uniref:Uncharacterized protein n=1 Tax=Heyndrickxia coagulans TaxID=1398 RepID=A0A150KHP5_HEYCO|nr:hypothetical protein B4099_3211 [Heyndrickxia coagulans]
MEFHFNHLLKTYVPYLDYKINLLQLKEGDLKIIEQSYQILI